MKKKGILPNQTKSSFQTIRKISAVNKITDIFNANLSEPLPLMANILINSKINTFLLLFSSSIRAITDKAGKINGAFAYRTSKDKLHVSLLAIDKNTPCTSLLPIVDELKTVANTLGLQTISCFRDTGNAKLTKLYTSLGFQDIKKNPFGMTRMEASVENFGSRLENISKRFQKKA